MPQSQAPAFLLVHGFGAFGEQWRGQIKALTAAGYQVWQLEESCMRKHACLCLHRRHQGQMISVVSIAIASVGMMYLTASLARHETSLACDI